MANRASMIFALRVALEQLGMFSATVAENTGRRGRPGKTYWLNKKQALYVCTKSETPMATEVTIQMVEVFDAYLSGKAVAVAPPVLAPGLFYVRLGRREALVDANDYQIGAGDEAVVCDHEGRISVLRGPLAPNTTSPWLGARSVMGPWRKPKQIYMAGLTAERGSYTVLGRLIALGERRRRMVAAA